MHLEISGGPETITIQHMREGRYRYRVSEYKGPQENAERLKLSGAFVSVYTAGGYWNFEVGRDRDGFLKVKLNTFVYCACEKVALHLQMTKLHVPCNMPCLCNTARATRKTMRFVS